MTAGKDLRLECVCGHTKAAHNFDGDGSGAIILDEYGDSWCIECTHVHRGFYSFHQFELDNLRHLEELSR
jgi:hypothetical protein